MFTAGDAFGGFDLLALRSKFEIGVKEKDS